MYVCVCNAVTERQIRQAISRGAATAAQLRETLGVATGCGSCQDCLGDYLAQTASEVAGLSAGATAGATAAV